MRTHLRFTVAKHSGQYQAVHRLMKSEHQDRCKLGFPTIMAYEGNDLVGFVGTQLKPGMIIAGPLVVKSDRRRLFTIMRLCEAYEGAMASMGITTFILSAKSGSILDRAIKRYFPDQHPYAMDGQGNEFYTWRVSHGRRSEGPRSLTGREGTTEEPGGASRPPT
jgi:hypothetical protein